jgi:hypothetical protein
MKRVCLVKSTGKLIEMQDGGSTQAHLDTLKQNAINAGYLEQNIEVKFVNESEWNIIYSSEKNESSIAIEEFRKDLSNIDKQLLAVVKIMIDEINILRDKHNLSSRTFEQIKTIFRTKMES